MLRQNFWEVTAFVGKTFLSLKKKVKPNKTVTELNSIVLVPYGLVLTGKVEVGQPFALHNTVFTETHACWNHDLTLKDSHMHSFP